MGVSRAQGCSWVLLVVVGVIVSISLLPLAFPIACLLFLLLYALVLTQVVAITVHDPAPKEVRERRAQGHRPAPRPAHSGHVIQEGYCTICEVIVPPGTKHCKRCNKCTQSFDHHCVWLNTCIGGRNYTQFLVLIISLSILLTAVSIVLLALIVLGFSHNEALKLSREGENMTISLEWVEVPLVGYLLMDVVLFLLLGLFDALLIHLIYFHLKLRTTTYSYIQNKKQKGSRATDTLTGATSSDRVASSSVMRRGETPILAPIHSPRRGPSGAFTLFPTRKVHDR